MVDDVRDKSAANQNDYNFENVIENEHFLVVAIGTCNTISLCCNNKWKILTQLKYLFINLL